MLLIILIMSNKSVIWDLFSIWAQSYSRWSLSWDFSFGFCGACGHLFWCPFCSEQKHTQNLPFVLPFRPLFSKNKQFHAQVTLLQWKFYLKREQPQDLCSCLLWNHYQQTLQAPLTYSKLDDYKSQHELFVMYCSLKCVSVCIYWFTRINDRMWNMWSWRFAWEKDAFVCSGSRRGNLQIWGSDVKGKACAR